MRPRFFLLFLLCASSFYASAQLRPIKKDELVSLVQNPSPDTLHVFNFWATWCKPCVKEIPYFLQANEKYAGQKIRFHFVSFDMKKNKTAVDSFIVKRKMPDSQFLMDETDFDPLITALDEKWDGAIPYTIFVKGSQRQTKASDFESAAELFQVIEQFIKN